MVVGGGKQCSSCVTNSSLIDSDLISSNSGQTTHKLKLKVLVQKSNKKLLCAHGENPLLEELFNFLTVPLGAFVCSIRGSSQLGITNLYNSISCLGDGSYFKSNQVKTMLLCSKSALTYYPPNKFSWLLSVQDTDRTDFLKGQATFIISNDLEITASPSTATISKCNTLGVPVGW
ncbi:hypothetical protein L2E82_21746 [Cichorium intybus]|uniref:Uncharacterized protein n=1 Tax=Cichorium intybus TaxID=13427 RepID=A0ACB9DW07_CICIN|nr:hypothetical protein L2E82_21746 [Cichorium intybus]